MESITKKIYTDLFRSSTPVSNTVILPGEIHLGFYLLEYATHHTMTAATTTGPDHVSADLLRAGEHRLHEILAEHLTSYLQEIRIPDQ
ncbi:unnamed protein product [Strongylus vulgaris]|uniref:Uncharacterized protein n=1 Tax=Strongylus vulgaris TaxID=40348 RepID=A0A3P7KL05_STRVU|nr:unnamed protein product [Strongylus vulgaris]